MLWRLGMLLMRESSRTFYDLDANGFLFYLGFFGFLDSCYLSERAV